MSPPDSAGKSLTYGMCFFEASGGASGNVLETCAIGSILTVLNQLPSVYCDQMYKPRCEAVQGRKMGARVYWKWI